jgi:hypothetical protein
MMILKAILVAAIAAAVPGATAKRLGKAVEADRELIILDAYLPENQGCIELRNGSTKAGSRLVLGDCSKRANGFDEKDAGNGLVQLVSRKDKTMCMQVKPLKEGSYLVLSKCGGSRFQLFDWDGQIVPADDKTLCVAYHGAHADVGDFIKLKKCTRFPDGWSHD